MDSASQRLPENCSDSELIRAQVTKTRMCLPETLQLCSSNRHCSWHGAMISIAGLALSGVVEVDGTCLLTLLSAFRFGCWLLAGSFLLHRYYGKHSV